MAASAFAYNFSYKTEIYNYVSTARSYRAITQVTSRDSVDIITAGLQCLRTDTGAVVGSGDLYSLENATRVEASECIPYNPYGIKVRGFGSHSAYKSGQIILYEFTQTANAA